MTTLGILISLLLTISAQAKAEVFLKAKLSLNEGEKTRQVDVALTYNDKALVVVDRKSGAPVKSFAYAEVKSAEYSYGKSPRWKTAIFVSPLFLFTSGKKHWFMIQGGSDYGVMQLDKSNYKMILAAFETKTGKKIEIVADNK